ncbi:hypothetical protein [Phormidium tenue]|uniref:hypothetical protein n=1 Tax=Phormidium tenue TaxID=126344 RepID=UPI0011150CFE|nr:hypothetical protein [Phormidium tenue]MBD2232365.1 hypothetical protein [Phormidium tenue FACHB-1052]
MTTSLTLDLSTSASILGTQPDLFLRFLKTKNIPGVLFFAEEPQVSIFTLAQLLNTQPEILMDWLEDEALGQLIEEVDDDEWLEGEAGQAFYQSILAGEG